VRACRGELFLAREQACLAREERAAQKAGAIGCGASGEP